MWNGAVRSGRPRWILLTGYDFFVCLRQRRLPHKVCAWWTFFSEKRGQGCCLGCRSKAATGREILQHPSPIRRFSLASYPCIQVKTFCGATLRTPGFRKLQSYPEKEWGLHKQGNLIFRTLSLRSPDPLPAREWGHKEAGSKWRSNQFASTTGTSHIRDNWAGLAGHAAGRERRGERRVPWLPKRLRLWFLFLHHVAFWHPEAHKIKIIYDFIYHVYHAGPQNRG